MPLVITNPIPPDPDLFTLNDVSAAGTFDIFPPWDAAPRSLYMKPDGTKMYFTGGASGARLFEFNMTTPFECTNASMSHVSTTSISGVLPLGLFFKPDGTKMYVSDESTEVIYEYDLSPAWDSSTASLNQTSASFGAQNPGELYIRSDGLKLYIQMDVSNVLREYDLTVAWDISTLSFVDDTASGYNGLSFKSDGTKYFVAGSTVVREYDVSTAWDISTASFVQSFNTGIASNTGVKLKSDGSRMYVLDHGPDSITQYDLT